MGFTNHLYRLICLLAAIGLTLFCISDYCQDESSTAVSFKLFHGTHKDYYPSMTMCFKNPFIDAELKKYKHLAITNTSVFKSLDTYKNFLSGAYFRFLKWNDVYDTVDYDHVTFRIDDFVKSVDFFLMSRQRIKFIHSGNRSLQIDKVHTDKKFQNHSDFKFATTLRHPRRKCFTMNVPIVLGDQLHSMSFVLNGSVFPNGFQPSKKEQDI